MATILETNGPLERLRTWLRRNCGLCGTGILFPATLGMFVPSNGELRELGLRSIRYLVCTRCAGAIPAAEGMAYLEKRILEVLREKA